MLLLVKMDRSFGLAAHIPDAEGKPLCKARLNLATWQLQEQSTEKIVICNNCRRTLERNERSLKERALET